MSRGLELERAVFVAPPADLGAYFDTICEKLRLPDDVPRRVKQGLEKRFDVNWDELVAERLAVSMASPLLVLHDRHDKEVPIDNGERLAHAWPGSVLEITEGLGHRRILRDPLVVDRAVAFIGDSSAARPGATLPSKRLGRALESASP